MKLITKNLTGHLSNGDRYRISFSDEKCPVIESKRIISVFLHSFNEELNTWVLDDVVCSSYQSKEDYQESLKEALINAESKFKMDLLKSEMSIAV